MSSLRADRVPDVPALASRILSYLSHDALTWPVPTSRSLPQEPIRLRFSWVGRPRGYTAQLLHALSEYAQMPFVTKDYPSGRPLLTGQPAAPADLHVALEERWHQDELTLYYEITGHDAVDGFAGFFSLES